MSVLLAKYAASVAAGTALYHLHACFKLSDAVLGGSSESAGGLGDAGWWQGKALLGAMSLLLQKLPIFIMGVLFRIERMRRRADAMKLKPFRLCGLCRVPRAFAVVPWITCFLLVVASFGTTIILTSTGFLKTLGLDSTAHCDCAGIMAGKDVENDWITLLLMVIGFQTLVYRPIMILIGTLLFLAMERRMRLKRAWIESKKHRVIEMELSPSTASMVKHGREGKNDEGGGGQRMSRTDSETVNP